MEFEWDESNRRHLARHNVTPQEFEEAMSGFRIVQEVEDVDAEERYQEMGATKSLRVLFLVYTYRHEKIRPITAWNADDESVEDYFRQAGERTDG